jgi:hypothetical protein
MSTREIPDGPEGEYRYMVITMVDAFGKPRQLEMELRKVIERLFYTEFGECATVTQLRRTDDSTSATEITLLDDDTVGTTGSTDPGVVEG